MTDLMARFGPQIAAVAFSFALGYVAGRVAKKALRKTLLVAGAVVLVLAALGVIGLDLATVQGWLQSGSAWAHDNLDGPARYLAALLPSAVAATAGAAAGFRGGRRDDRELRGGDRRPSRR
jgi:uncharacterized membrane protein (Fun14 family)